MEPAPVIPDDLLASASKWDSLHPWERKRLGIALRRLGLTHTEIRSVVPVPKSTLHGWLRDVRLSPRQDAAIRRRTSRWGRPVDTQWRRRLEIAHIRSEAHAFAAAHLDDPLFVAGTVMYWAEGAKTRNFVDLANSDPKALVLFIRWARRYLGVDDFQLSLHLHAGNDERAAKDYWLRALDLPRASFGKTYTKQTRPGHRNNRLVHGVCRVRTRRAADNWHRVMVFIDVVATSLSAEDAPSR